LVINCKIIHIYVFVPRYEYQPYTLYADGNIFVWCIQPETGEPDLVNVEHVYQEMRIIFRTYNFDDGDSAALNDIRAKLRKVFTILFIDENQHDMIISRMFKTKDFFPIVYEFFMTSVLPSRSIMHILRLPKRYYKLVVVFEEFYSSDLSEIVVLKDFLGRLEGDYELGYKFCLYYELYGVKNNFEEARTLLKVLQLKAKQGQEEPYMLSHLKVRGADLFEIGFRGRTIKSKMNEFLHLVKVDPAMNDRENLLAFL